MEVTSLKRTLQRNWVVGWVTFVVIAILGLAAAYLPAERYEATTVVSVQPAEADTGVSPQLLTYLIPSLEARVSGSSLKADVENTLPADLRGETWVVDTTVPTGSGVLSIKVTSQTAQLPVAAANAYAQILSKQDLGTTRLQVLVIDPAAVATNTTSRTTTLVSGFVLALILAPLAAIMAGRRHTISPRRPLSGSNAPAPQLTQSPAVTTSTVDSGAERVAASRR